MSAGRWARCASRPSPAGPPTSWRRSRRSGRSSASRSPTWRSGRPGPVLGSLPGRQGRNGFRCALGRLRPGVDVRGAVDRPCGRSGGSPRRAAARAAREGHRRAAGRRAGAEPDPAGLRGSGQTATQPEPGQRMVPAPGISGRSSAVTQPGDRSLTAGHRVERPQPGRQAAGGGGVAAGAVGEPERRLLEDARRALDVDTVDVVLVARRPVRRGVVADAVDVLELDARLALVDPVDGEPDRRRRCPGR